MLDRLTLDTLDILCITAASDPAEVYQLACTVFTKVSINGQILCLAIVKKL